VRVLEDWKEALEAKNNPTPASEADDDVDTEFASLT
jgi:hypothetical protein